MTDLAFLCPAAWLQCRLGAAVLHCSSTAFFSCFNALYGLLCLHKYSSDMELSKELCCTQLHLSTLWIRILRAKYLCWHCCICFAFPFYAKGQFCVFLTYRHSFWVLCGKSLVLTDSCINELLQI